jgi:thymidylate synthase (FAD)
MKIIQPSVELIWITPDAAKTIEVIGRTCYKSEDKITPDSYKAFIDKIKTLGHFSVLEHCSASFRVICDRGISHEIVRHRIASYSQESTRYVNYTKENHGSGNIQFILPEGLNQAQEQSIKESYLFAELGYNECIASGMSPQQARDILPNGLKTEIVMTANFREWLHFIKLRTSPKAHPKMQTVANMIKSQLQELCPEVFND